MTTANEEEIPEPKVELSKEESERSQTQSPLLHSFADYSDAKVVEMVNQGKVSQYKLEQELIRSVMEGKESDCARAVRIRRLWIQQQMRKNTANKLKEDALSIDDNESSVGLPYSTFDHEDFYRNVLGRNCENVVGFIPLPVGFVGPVLLDGKTYYVPMATTEGALLASTNRGCRAITESGGATSDVVGDGMTRAPALRMPTARDACKLVQWVKKPESFQRLKDAFESTTRFGKLDEIKASIAGRNVHLRFKCSTGDAMGMNMISKGVLRCLEEFEAEFEGVELLSLSGNMCTDKKPSAVNWTEGRGKSVVTEVMLSAHVITDVLKCTAKSLAELNASKNLIGSALAGSIGGFNAHASNIVTACFLATGQDPAQNVESSMCMTLMEEVEGGGLRVSVTMPCIEVGTVGGGTSLPAQRACLDMMGVGGASTTAPGDNAQELAKIISTAVLAGELSLMSALASNHLVSAHMKLNRVEDKKPAQ